MITLRQDPYLWWHLAGVATLPIWLDGCLAGLAVGDPAISVGLELGLLLLLGVLPTLGLQWFRPVYLFRVGPLSLRPGNLTGPQLRLLTCQQGWRQKVVALLASIGLASLLIALYQMAPIAAAITPFAGIGRAAGWWLCAGCFFCANWFGQTALAALGLLLARERTLDRTQPYAVTAIAHDFSGLGIQIGQIFPQRWLSPLAAAATTLDSAASRDATQSESVAESPAEIATRERSEAALEVTESNPISQVDLASTAVPARGPDVEADGPDAAPIFQTEPEALAIEDQMEGQTEDQEDQTPLASEDAS
ncbi:MAG: low-complexity tail membrane protein [Leptolyngbya sp. RL_3_1]|nr:low-complexity tail membrane protein [Leptolyngbya sp. RL_3_1]